MTKFSGHNLICIRGERLVFTNLEFSVETGGVLVLVGHNGSGKSSLLRMMAGMLRPAVGMLAWDGIDVRKDLEDHRNRLHYVGHHDAVKPVLTVAENLNFWANLRLDNPDRRKAFEDALEIFSIGHLLDVPGRFLSAGQKRRVNLARIIAAPAPIWLLDEPVTALDKASIKALENTMENHRKTGGIVILSTHTDMNLTDTTTLNVADFKPDPGQESAMALAAGI